MDRTQCQSAYLQTLGIETNGSDAEVHKRLEDVINNAGLTDRERAALCYREGLTDGRKLTPAQVHIETFGGFSEEEAEKDANSAHAKVLEQVRKDREVPIQIARDNFRDLIGRKDDKDPVEMLRDPLIAFPDQRQAVELTLGLADGVRHSTIETAHIMRRDPAWVRATVTGVLARLKE